MNMEQGWDPEIKKYFRKIVSSIFPGVLWLLSGLTVGLYLGLGYRKDISVIYIVLFYLVFVSTFILLIRHLYRVWKK